MQHIESMPYHVQSEAREAFESALVAEPDRISPEQRELRQALGVA